MLLLSVMSVIALLSTCLSEAQYSYPHLLFAALTPRSDSPLTRRSQTFAPAAVSRQLKARATSPLRPGRVVLRRQLRNDHLPLRYPIARTTSAIRREPRGSPFLRYSRRSGPFRMDSHESAPPATASEPPTDPERLSSREASPAGPNEDRAHAFSSEHHSVHRGGTADIDLHMGGHDVVLAVDGKDDIHALHLKEVRGEHMSAARIATRHFLDRLAAQPHSGKAAPRYATVYTELSDVHHDELQEWMRAQARDRRLRLRWDHRVYNRGGLQGSSHPGIKLGFDEDGRVERRIFSSRG